MVPELLTLTLRTISSIATTSIGPSRWPTLRMQDTSLAGSGGRAGKLTFSNACFLANMVVIPTGVTVGIMTGGEAASCWSGGRRRKTLLPAITPYGLPAALLTNSAVLRLNKRPPKSLTGRFPKCLMPSDKHRQEPLVAVLEESS
jgi:hypothetical protein